MKFALLFDSESPGDVTPGVDYLSTLVECTVCGDQTHFASPALRAGLCSSECAGRLPSGALASELAPPDGSGPERQAA
jgi:hypothetical protein